MKDISDHKCSYCKTRPAKHYFITADRYCCEDKYHRCPQIKEEYKQKMRAINAHRPSSILRVKCEAGEMSCKYCGKPSKHLLGYDKPCCSPKAKLCPEYKGWLSEKKKQAYADNPEYGKRMSKAMKECQNRESVKQAKSEKMLILHNEDCEPCKEFQKNYREGHKKRDMSNIRRKDDD